MAEFAGIDIEALKQKLVQEHEYANLDSDVIDGSLDRAVRIVLQSLAEDGRLGVEKEYADLIQPEPEFGSFDTELIYPTQQAGADRFRYVGPWLPLGDQPESTRQENGNG
jgi:hypothetical protein